MWPERSDETVVQALGHLDHYNLAVGDGDGLCDHHQEPLQSRLTHTQVRFGLSSLAFSLFICSTSFPSVYRHTSMTRLCLPKPFVLLLTTHAQSQTLTTKPLGGCTQKQCPTTIGWGSTQPLLFGGRSPSAGGYSMAQSNHECAQNFWGAPQRTEAPPALPHPSSPRSVAISPISYTRT